MKHDITRASDAGLRVDVIDTWEGFEALRPEWDRLAARDPEGTVFLGWEWLAQAFRANPYRWSVLVARSHEGGALAILPLKYRVHWSRSRQEFHTELEAGGRLLFSEYTGFLCNPSFEAQGLEALAARLARLPWMRLRLRYVAQERRARAFAAALEARGCTAAFKDYMINKGETNNLICPQVALPDSFDDYLGGQVSANRRQKWHRFLRKRIESDECRFTVADADSAGADIDALLVNWMGRWEGDKGEATAAKVAENYRAVLRAAQAQGDLFLPMLRKGDEVLGALGHVVDHDRGRVHFIVAGRNVQARDPFIGAALHFYSIDWAIRQGFGLYDFGHGNEAYKYSFGPEDRELLYLELRRGAYNRHLAFDSIGTGAALERIEGFLTDGKPDRAARGLAQLRRLFS